MSVYFVQAQGLEPVKIGYANAGGVRDRLRALQTGSPVRLLLKSVIEGEQDLERELHRRFAKLRLHGEWFHPDHEMELVAGVRLCGNLEHTRLSFRVAEAAEVLGVSEQFFRDRIAQELRWVRRGAVKLVARNELEAWLAREASLTLSESVVARALANKPRVEEWEV